MNTEEDKNRKAINQKVTPPGPKVVGFVLSKPKKTNTRLINKTMTVIVSNMCDLSLLFIDIDYYRILYNSYILQYRLQKMYSNYEQINKYTEHFYSVLYLNYSFEHFIYQLLLNKFSFRHSNY